MSLLMSSENLAHVLPLSVSCWDFYESDSNVTITRAIIVQSCYYDYVFFFAFGENYILCVS